MHSVHRVSGSYEYQGSDRRYTALILAPCRLVMTCAYRDQFILYEAIELLHGVDMYVCV